MKIFLSYNVPSAFLSFNQRLLQVRQAGSSASGIEGTVEAIKGHVADVTEQVDLALDRHRAHKRAEQKQAKVRGNVRGEGGDVMSPHSLSV